MEASCEEWPSMYNVNAVEALQDPKESIVNPGYVIEVADGKKVKVDRIIRDCKPELGNSLFGINLIPLGHGCFDVIVGMYLVVPEEGWERTLGAAKALMNAKVDEPKLSDISVVQNFVDVFPEDLLGLPPQRQVELRIDLVPGVTSVAKSPYRATPLEMQEFIWALQELQGQGSYDQSPSLEGAQVMICLRKRMALFESKNQKYVWGVEQEEALQALKNNLCDAPILSLPDGVEDYVEWIRIIYVIMNVKFATSGKRDVVADALSEGMDQQMEKKGDGSLYFMDRIWVPLVGGVRTVIMDEAHKSRNNKGYCYLVYRIVNLVQKVKAEHQRHPGLLQQPEIPKWKWESITMDFITKFSTKKLVRLVTIDENCRASWSACVDYVVNNSKEWNSGNDQLRLRWMIYLVVLEDAIESVREAIRSEYCLASSSGWTKGMYESYFGGYNEGMSPVLWAEIRESSLIGPELVLETTNKILERIGLVAYRLRLSEELSGVHDTFHVSNLKKCLADASLHVPLDEIKVDKTLHFVEEPVEIMDREIKSLKRSKISLVKVRWNSKRGPEFTWEREDYINISILSCLLIVLMNRLVKSRDEIS
ncbi:hypothetical protein Tco_0537080 [Tanacetum coccineum]